MSTKSTILRKNDRCQSTGHGRTEYWGACYGRVTRVTGGRVYVQWEGTSFEDEMEAGEVAKVEG